MTAFQKQSVTTGSLVVAALLLGFWLTIEGSPSQSLTVKIRRVATSPGLASAAVIDLKLARPAVVNLHAHEYKVEEQWLETAVPKSVSDEFEKVFSIQEALKGRCSLHLHGATNWPWRLTFEVVEPRTGWAGLQERLQNPVGYRRAGGWLNVLFGIRPVRYTGSYYFVQSEEISDAQ